MDIGVYTLGEIKTHVSKFVQDPSTTMLGLIDDWVNGEYQNLIQKSDWPQLRAIYTNGLSFVSGSPRFYCPRDVLTPLGLHDNTNNRFISAVPLDIAVRWRPSTFDQAGDPLNWSAVEDSGMEQDFHSAAELLSIVSDNAADTSKTIRIAYKTSAGIRATATVMTDPSNGTTPVLTTFSALGIIRVSCTDSRAGTITVTGNTSSKVYTKLGALENAAVYKVLYISRVPSGANAAVLIYKRAPSKLVNDTDIPEIPVGHYLRVYARANAMQFDGKHQEAEAHFREADGILQSIFDDSKAGGSAVTPSMPAPKPKQFFRRMGGWRQSSG